MLIHCDPLRPTRETCHELPVRTTVSTLASCKAHFHPPRPAPLHQAPSPFPFSFSKQSALYCIDQSGIKKAGVLTHRKHSWWVSGDPFVGALQTSSQKCPQKSTRLQWHRPPGKTPRTAARGSPGADGAEAELQAQVLPVWPRGKG
jgi:hypothetical protein